jgi:small subunit ribosomal protein S1
VIVPPIEKVRGGEANKTIFGGLCMTMVPGNANSETEDFDWTQLLDEYDYARPQRGEVRDGVVMKIEDDSILVSIGTKREGVIPQQDLRQMGDEFVDALQVGQTIQVYVQDPENREGELVLSLTMVQVARDWEEAARLSGEGGIVQGQVIGYNKGGLLVQFNRIRGFVPASQVAQLHGRTAAEERQQALQRMVGQTIPLKVIEVDRERNRLVLSERSATQEWRKAQKQRLLTELQPGDVLSGRVNQLTNFGAFIDLGGADGLAHISELSWQRVNHPREVLSPGQEVKVMVVEIDPERERIGLSIATHSASSSRARSRMWRRSARSCRSRRRWKGLFTRVSSTPTRRPSRATSCSPARRSRPRSSASTSSASAWVSACGALAARSRPRTARPRTWARSRFSPESSKQGPGSIVAVPALVCCTSGECRAVSAQCLCLRVGVRSPLRLAVVVLALVPHRRVSALGGFAEAAERETALHTG